MQVAAVTKQFSEKITTIQAETHDTYTGYTFEKTNSKRLPFGPDLSAMAFNNDANKLFVVKNSNHTLYVFDSNVTSLTPNGTRVIREDVPEERDVQGVAVDPVTDLTYVTNRDNRSISLVNGTSPYAIIRNITISGANPDAIAVNPKTNIVYVADRFSGIVYVIDSKCIIERKGCSIIPVKTAIPSEGIRFEHPIGIAVNPNSDMVYVTNPISNTVSVINGKTNNISVTLHVYMWITTTCLFMSVKDMQKFMSAASMSEKERDTRVSFNSQIS